MADEADVGMETEALFTEASISRIRAKAGTRDLHPVGTCYWCHAPVADPKLFCDRDCADDHHRSMSR